MSLVAAIPAVIFADILMVGLGATYPHRMIAMAIGLLLLIPVSG